MVCKVALVSDEPVWFDLKASVEKCIMLIERASKNGAEMIAFPEVFIPGYPVWLWANAADMAKNIDYIENSLEVDSQEFCAIRLAAKANNINVVLGFSEKSGYSIYISQAIISSDGALKLKRRKLKATHVERALYGDGKASDVKNVTALKFHDGSFNVGCLNCAEHNQPLLAYSGATQNEEIHVGGWPPLSHYGPGGIYSLSYEGLYALATAYAMQNHCFYLFVAPQITDAALKKCPEVPPLFPLNEKHKSSVIGPDGAPMEMQKEVDGLLFYDLDPKLITFAAHIYDNVGHYSRPDIFSIRIHKPNEDTHLNENSEANTLKEEFVDVTELSIEP